MALTTLLALAVVWIGGDLFFLRWVRTLVGATRQLTAGDLSARSGLPYGRGELGQLTRAFDEMAETLQKRQIESEHLEEILRESGRRLRAIFNQTFQFMCLLRSDGTVLEINQTALDFGGLKNADVFGQYLWEIRWWTSSPETQRIIKDGISKASKGDFFRHEVELRGRDDTVATIDFSLKPVKDETGQVVLLIFEGRDITERKQAEKAMLESERQLRYLSSQLLSAQEKERKRIAQELHDSIGQALSAIKFSVESARNKIADVEDGFAHAAMEALDSVVPMIQHTIEEARRIMTDLRPSILDDLGIVTTIGWFCREYQKIYPSIYVEKEIGIEEAEVPDHLKIVIYRVLQEALHNIAKYSRAEFVSVSLSRNDREIELLIEDNGQGFDIKEALSVESIRKGLGLTSMKERTELSGGEFFLESVQGDGTTIRAHWPLLFRC